MNPEMQIHLVEIAAKVAVEVRSAVAGDRIREICANFDKVYKSLAQSVKEAEVQTANSSGAPHYDETSSDIYDYSVQKQGESNST